MREFSPLTLSNPITQLNNEPAPPPLSGCSVSIS